MYTEDYEKRGYPIRSFVQKLILVVIFALLLVWLLPKYITPTVKTTECSKGTCDTSGIDALTSQIFSNNLEKMKDAAISYYTDERLPKKVGESSKMTLSDMIGKKLITPLIDKNNKAVDVEASYVEITKLDDEYLLKVNIKDSEKEDYILVHLGCYHYCNSYLCEKQSSSVNVPIKGSKVTPTIPIKGGKINPENPYNYPDWTPSNKPSKSPKPSDKPSPSDKPKPSDKPSPSDKPKPSDKPTPSDKPSPKPSDKPTPTPTYKPSYLYQYRKVTNAKLSGWTNWSNWSTTSCSTPKVECDERYASCRFKRQTTSRKEKIGTYDKKYETWKSEVRQVASYNEKTCSNYNYVRIDDTIYATTTNTTYSTINSITSSRQSSAGYWSYQGRSSYSNPPRDGAGVSYKFVGADYSYCGNTCETLPHYYYDKYVYVGGLTKVSSTTTPGRVTTSSSSSTTSNTNTSYSGSCGSYTYRTVPVYRTVSVPVVSTRKENIYGTVCYKSEKSRSIISRGTIRYRWSSYNNRSLLNDGWSYTGKKKAK